MPAATLVIATCARNVICVRPSTRHAEREASMAAKKKVTKIRPSGSRRMTSGDAVFAELEAMTDDEQAEIIPRLKEWIDERAVEMW